MFSFMGSQTTGLDETCIAFITSVGFLACVCSLVCSKVIGLGETLVALTADVRFLTAVDPHVGF